MCREKFSLTVVDHTSADRGREWPHQPAAQSGLRRRQGVRDRRGGGGKIIDHMVDNKKILRELKHISDTGRATGHQGTRYGRPFKS